MTVDLVELSRMVSHALRHEPWRYELELDEHGWAPVDQVLDALHANGGDWTLVDREVLEWMIASSTKRRHELQGDRIRALYGHSLPRLIKRTPAPPPARLFHGTASDALGSIRAAGLRPMRRQYVHLSIDTDTATAVGRRKSRDSVILCVDAAAAHAEGVVFYEANEMVWLADHVPRYYIEVVG